MKNNKRKIIAIVGPTASGKTGIGVRLAKEFNGEIISADSRQVYRGLDIGTGKDLADFGDIKYHMIDIVNPEEKMTLFDYLPLARAAIEDIFAQGKVPIVVGGTGLYIQALVEGFELEKNNSVILNDSEESRAPRRPLDPSAAPQDDKIKILEDDKLDREELDNKTVPELNNILMKLDPEKWEKVDKKNAHRLIRAIEMAQDGLKPIKVKPDFEVLQIGIDIPRAELFDRIDRRVDERFAAGMLEEVAGLLKKGVDPEWLQNLGLEYREITQYLLDCHFDSLKGAEKSLASQKISPTPTESSGGRDDRQDKFESMKQRLEFKIHQFARRQLTWFRRFPEINWLSDYDEIKRFVRIFLEH